MATGDRHGHHPRRRYDRRLRTEPRWQKGGLDRDYLRALHRSPRRHRPRGAGGAEARAALTPRAGGFTEFPRFGANMRRAIR